MTSQTVFDSAELTVTCPSCSHQMKKPLGWLRSHDHLVCSGCSQTIRLENKQFSADIESANKSPSDFKRSLGKLGLKLR